MENIFVLLTCVKVYIKSVSELKTAINNTKIIMHYTEINFLLVPYKTHSCSSKTMVVLDNVLF